MYKNLCMHKSFFMSCSVKPIVLLHLLLQAFARRAIVKINELSEIMNMSSEPQSKETEKTFRLATVKVFSQIFMLCYKLYMLFVPNVITVFNRTILNST